MLKEVKREVPEVESIEDARILTEAEMAEIRNKNRIEIEKIIDKKILEFALTLPAVLSNLVMESSAKFNLFKDFLTEHKDLYQNHPDLIQKIIMEVEGNNPGKSYSEILKLSVPIIKERLNIIKGLDFTKSEKPKDLSFKTDMGEL